MKSTTYARTKGKADFVWFVILLKIDYQSEFSFVACMLSYKISNYLTNHENFMSDTPMSDVVSNQYALWTYPDPILDLPGWLQNN
jgi:hypothetical protein